jgi:Na+-transporting methylmalonyl-CoA/oxaloacetate decarboxylase gamma subunit
MGLGMGEVILILFLLACLGAVFAVLFFLAKNMTVIGGKTCPHCAEKIKTAAKIRRFCQRDVTGV